MKKPTPKQLVLMRELAICGWDVVDGRMRRSLSTSPYVHVELDEEGSDPEAHDIRYAARLTDEGAAYLTEHEGFKLHKDTDESWTMRKPANSAPLSRAQRADLGLARQLAFEVADAMVRYNDGRLEHILPAETIERIESYEIVRKNIRG